MGNLASTSKVPSKILIQNTRYHIQCFSVNKIISELPPLIKNNEKLSFICPLNKFYFLN